MTCIGHYLHHFESGSLRVVTSFSRNSGETETIWCKVHRSELRESEMKNEDKRRQQNKARTQIKIINFLGLIGISRIFIFFFKTPAAFSRIVFSV